MGRLRIEPSYGRSTSTQKKFDFVAFAMETTRILHTRRSKNKYKMRSINCFSTCQEEISRFALEPTGNRQRAADGLQSENYNKRAKIYNLFSDLIMMQRSLYSLNMQGLRS